MTQEIDLEKIERKTYLAFQQDGIWDLTLGLALLAVAADLLWGVPGPSAALIIVAIVLAPVLKKAVTMPRLGYVKFSPERESKEKKKISGLMIFFSMTALLGLVVFYAYTGDAEWQHWIRSLGLLPLGFVVALTAFVLGILYQVRRCLVYSVVAMAAFTATHALDLHPWFHFLVIGVMLTSVGSVLLVRFVTRYPRPVPEDSSHV